MVQNLPETGRLLGVKMDKNVTQRQLMRLFAVHLILSYEQKCEIRSKFLKNQSMLRNKLWHKFFEFFTNIGTKLADKITPHDSNYVSPLKSKNQQNSIFLNPTNPDEIIEITKKLKGSNSSGIDNISTKVLKSIINELPRSFLIYLTGLYLLVLFHHN